MVGKVITDGKPVAGVPVVLWPIADVARRSLGGYLQILSTTDGRFRFESLPPGDYKILVSFDVNEVDDEFIGMSNAANIHAEALESANIEVPVWIAP